VHVAQADLGLARGFVLVALPLDVVVPNCHNSQLLALLQLDGLVVLEHGCAHLGPLGVQEGADLDILLSSNLAQAVKHLLVSRVLTVAEVEPGHVHARIHQLRQALL